MKTRVRFAPSPTGALHIGGVRTALYNYLFAKQHGGELIFRIEDTDSNRFVPGAEEYILEAFHWLGITFDEGVSFGGEYGPYRQSERRDIYKKYVKQLLDNGKAYMALDTPEELEQARNATPNFQYDAKTRMSMRNSLSMSKEEVQALLDEGKQYVVRFLINPGEEIVVNDLIRGVVRIKSAISRLTNSLHTIWQTSWTTISWRCLMSSGVRNGCLLHHCMCYSTGPSDGRILCRSLRICHCC